ncbi:PLP-dependent aminotransferase family protein [Caldimonas brevitalea]|uniref:GntR family transcriptional regulator n=1 Tax=Caldimonas brevitalea TaxID=413882 RepID=A0A0G3BWQ6_9BURK|nr:PLP-dependent aminotransferase family protein [Caldimonas brevitalea]AKJ31791.1 GntR family transcriptional regulator [Caldimonas brevitalea]
MIPLDRDSSVPLAGQIEAGLAARIGDGRLAPGMRLPSIRQLAAQLAVSPNTVVLAYDRLVAAGLIESRGTIGYLVCETESPPPELEPLEAGEEQDPVWLAQQASDQRPGVLLASSGALPLAWLEDGIPASLVQRALAACTGGMAARCPAQGLPALRERIAMLMRSQGIAADAGRVMTTFGATQALDLICRAFLRPGDRVLVEDPGFFLMFGRLRQAGVDVVPITRRPDGLDLAELEAALAEHRPRMLFVQSVLHNPTGWGSSAANLHRLLTLAERYDLLIAEDDVHGHFLPGQATRLAQLSGLSRVIYFSSFCKALSPALRLGWLAAEPALLKPLLREKVYSVLTTPALNEFVLLELLASGRFRKHVERLQQKLAQARIASISRLQQAGIVFEDGVGEGGLFLWGRVPQGVDIELLAKDAWRNRIVLAGGASFRARPLAADGWLRFNVAHSQHPRLADYLTQRFQALSAGGSTLSRLASMPLDGLPT